MSDKENLNKSAQPNAKDAKDQKGKLNEKDKKGQPKEEELVQNS